MAEFAERIKPKAQFVDEAIELALGNKWAEAVTVNRAIMDRFGPDEDTLNRLGKAYTEMSQLDEAVEAYQGTLKMNPVNPIALKNLSKLQGLRGGQPVPTSKAKVDVDAFIEETGKTALTALHVHGEGGDPCSKVSGGDPVRLIVAGDTMNVETARGVNLGHLEHALGRRLIKFIEGGNRYSGAVATCDANAIRIIVRETYQDPKFFGRPSFPIKKGREEFRPYAKESLLPRSVDAEDGEEDGEEASEDLDGMHTVDAAEEEVEVPEVDEDTRKEDVY